MPNESAALLGVDLFGEPVRRTAVGPLASRFLFPPFSVLNAREGEWQERKAAWLALGIKSELGRDENALGHPETTFNMSFYAKKRALEARLGRELETADAIQQLIAAGEIQPARQGVNGGWSAHPRYYEQKIAAEAKLGRPLSPEEFERDFFVVPDSQIATGTSIFDPVLCEVAYRWFAPPGGLVLDPFAGGSVRGLVASLLGLRYWGVDLRPEQVAANEAQRDELQPGAPVTWLCGDARTQIAAAAPEADLVFTCPPYGDLERYSDDPRDLSTMRYPDFLAAYREIIDAACERLRPARFAVIVVAEFRDADGYYRNFVGHTVDAFRRAGLAYYNEAVLLNAIGSLPVRVGRQFQRGRKLGKAHQNVLVFVKGDPRLAALAVEGPPPPEAEGNPDWPETGLNPHGLDEP